ncbi:reverse transcriptase domain-containing protein [Cytobacillus solani]|uniref:Reverse transcriptase domain-containing protein n=1 Tax=Cytobacillus solani TaxID=1637975 RepID=A0A0Q3VJG9_9BACI|nr:hypothetical protein AMS60_00140 [Bacillus sp. FJAT-21945]KQL21011.1 hypothetical protein AN957_22170 [Cytobacillus solani]
MTDRLIQQAIAQVLSKIYDPMFPHIVMVFGQIEVVMMRCGKQKNIKEGYRWVVDMDLEKFFDKVNHDRLMSTLTKRIDDKPL